MGEILIVILICISAFVISYVCGEQMKNYAKKNQKIIDITDKTKINELQEDTVEVSIDDIAAFSKSFIHNVINSGGLNTENEIKIINDLKIGISKLCGF